MKHTLAMYSSYKALMMCQSCFFDNDYSYNTDFFELTKCVLAWLRAQYCTNTIARWLLVVLFFRIGSAVAQL